MDHRYVPGTGRLEIAIEGEWAPVDPAAVLPLASPDGRALTRPQPLIAIGVFAD